jgi:nucleotide-binding universal stress UspA family protein
MNSLSKILVPTNLSEHSRRAIAYGRRLAEGNKCELVIVHIVNELKSWELNAEFEVYTGNHGQVWPLDRLLAEAALDLNKFLEPHIDELKRLPNATKRVILGSVPEQITFIAEEEKVDLIIMSPRRKRGLRHWLGAGITDQVTRISPCPVLSITEPLPSRPWRGRMVPLFFGWPRQRAVQV